jgi:pimeloyl-ACP methyl ester carboxylesterase
LVVGSSEGLDLLTLPDGRRAQFWQGGAASGPAVFFFHGCPDTRLAARTGDAAAQRCGVRLVAVNRPGYGRSETCESTQGSVADDTVAVADLLGIERFAVLGMSIGGSYALGCAARHPEWVSAAAALACPGMGSDMDPPWHRDDLTSAQQDLFAQIGRSTISDAIDAMRPDFEAFVAKLAPNDTDDAALAGRWIEGLHPLDVAAMSGLPVADLAAQAREALIHTDGYLRDAALTFRDWEFRPEDVRCPTWLWYGRLDPNAPPRNGRWLADRMPGATLTVREGTAHLSTLLESWDEILSTLRTSAGS